jgi:SecD/SecF fusion protein
VTTDERVIAKLAEANPVSDAAPRTAQQRAEADRVLARVLSDAPAAPSRRRRPRLGILVPVASVLVVVLVAAVILRTGGSGTTAAGGSGGMQIVLNAQPTSRTPQVSATGMSREIAVIRRRLGSLGRGYAVAQSGARQIVVTLPSGHAAQRERIVRLITQPAQLRFYDWEADVLTPNGKTVASQLARQDRTAVSVSQGGNTGAGVVGAGSMSLYAAVKLAATQPAQHDSSTLSRIGPEYYVFGAPGSAACTGLPTAGHAGPDRGGHCLIAGPLDGGGAAGVHDAVEVAASRYPSGRIPGRAEVVPVPQGTIVLQATQLDAAAPPTLSDPSAQFFVLRDRVALTGADITHPHAGTDQSGSPDVTFRFTGAGRAAFQQVTKAIAHRGANVSLGGVQLNQHFAVVLDTQLVTVPQIDFHSYPDGIIGGGGADIAGGLTPRSARDLATELRYGALPLALRVVR